MQILVWLVSAIGLIAYFIIRANQVNQAGRELLDTASEAKGFVRRSLWRRRTEVDPTRSIDDPRLAAAVMMCAVANDDGDITEREMIAMLDLMEQHFQMPRGACEEMLSEARWLAREAKDLGAFLQRLSKPIAASCTEAELADLFAMLEAVDRVEGEGSAIVADAVANLQRCLAVA